MTERLRQGIREIIHTLLSIFADNGIPRIPSESFRRAKFNQPEAINSFWSTLFCVVQLVQSLEANKLDCNSDLPSFDTHHYKTDKLSRKTIVYVRWHLFSLGYNRTNFFSDPIGSRELLLALAWLFHKADLFKKLSEYHLLAANSIRIPLKPNGGFVFDMTQKDVDVFRGEVEMLSKELTVCIRPDKSGEGIEELQNILQRLMWLKGKILCRWRSSLSKHQGFQRMADRLHRHTFQSSSGKHLTVHEVFLMRYPDQLTSYVQELEKHLLALQRLLDWQSYEPFFWQWMESVLDLDEKEKRENDSNPDLSSEEETRSVSVKAEDMSLQELESKIQYLEKEVLEILERNRPHIDKVNRIWSLKSKSVAQKELQSEFNHNESNIGLKIRSDDHDPSRCLCGLKNVECLTHIDLPLRSRGESVLKSTSKKSLTSLVQDQHKVNLDLLQFLNHKLEHVKCELKAVEEKIEMSKVNVVKQLEIIEQGFPPSVCKVVT